MNFWGNLTKVTLILFWDSGKALLDIYDCDLVYTFKKHFNAHQIGISVVVFPCLTYPYQPVGKIKKTALPRRICNVIMTSPYRSQRTQDFLEAFYHVFLIENVVFSGEQEKDIRLRMGWKNPSLAITDCHHSASLVMPIVDPRDGLFYPTLTHMKDSYSHVQPYYNKNYS